MKFTVINTSGNAGFSWMRIHRSGCKDILKEARCTGGNHWEIEARSGEHAIEVSEADQKADDNPLGKENYTIAPCALIAQKEYWIHPLFLALGMAPSNAQYWKIIAQTENGKTIYLAMNNQKGGGWAVGNKKWADQIIKEHGRLL